MRKIPTLFQRDENDRRYVTREVHPDAQWVLNGEGVATRKYDGTCVMLDDQGEWWARREVKPGKAAPAGFMAVSTDEVTGKVVGWEPIEQSPFVKFWREAGGENDARWKPGTYELIGPKVNGNPEQAGYHLLVEHADASIIGRAPRDYDGLRELLTSEAWTYEGIVWHHADGRMAKIKRRDFPRS
jgi:hypothetical protein